MQSFLEHFGINSFEIDFAILRNFSGVFTTILNIYDEVLSRFIFGKVLNTALLLGFLIFFHFLCLDTWVNVWTFCFSSESLQLISSCDVNQKCYIIFHWFPNHLLYTNMEITKFSYIYTTDLRKSSLWKTSRWNALYTIHFINYN